MSNNLPWSHAIEHSFFYSEYVAYGIEKQADRITLQVWEKSYKDEAISEAIDAGRLYLKYEWILPVINTIRGVPKQELAGGINYGDEWDRRIIPEPGDGPQKIGTTITFSNKLYEKSGPKLEITIYTEEVLASKRNSIDISHGFGIDGYARDVEPVLAELAKYVPRKDKEEILEPIAKAKTEAQLMEERYHSAIKENPARKTEPYFNWIKKQVDDAHYEVTALSFLNGELDYRKTIVCDIKSMAMIKKYMTRWIRDIKTAPYEQENSTLKLEITTHPQHENHMLAKLYIKQSEDYFEVPFKAEENCMVFYDLCSSTEAQRIHTQYLRKLHGFIEDDCLVLKWYSEHTREPQEEYAELFLVAKHDVPAFLDSLEYIRFCLISCYKKEDYSYREHNNYEFYIPTDYTNDTKWRFFLKNKKIKFIHNSIQYISFFDDFLHEYNKLYWLVRNLYEENPEHFIEKYFDRILWQSSYDYAGQDTVHYISWQFENSDEVNYYVLSKEKLFKIQMYSSWWWRSTDHSEATGFEDDELFFEITPVSDNKYFGTITLKLKKHQSKVKVYFDLSDGSNLPKNIMEYSYDKQILRKVQISDTADHVCFHWWDSKYTAINENTKHFSAIKKSHFEEFKSAIKEIYDFLTDSENHVVDLLSSATGEKYDREGFWIQFSTLSLATNCDTELTVDEDIPLDIVIYPRTGLEREYIPIYGTRKFLLFQLEKLIEGLEGYSG